MTLRPGDLVAVPNRHGREPNSVRQAQVRFVSGDTVHVELLGMFFHTMPEEHNVRDVKLWTGGSAT